MARLAGSLALVLLGAIASFAQLPVTGRIVDDIEEKPVANARVELRSDAFTTPIVRTDADGRFTFSVPAGTYKLTVEKAEFFPYPNDSVEVREGSPGDLALVLTKVRSVTARLVWPDGEPVTRIAIYLRSRNGRRMTPVDPPGARASENQINYSGLQPGRYVLLADPVLAPSRGRTGIPTEIPSPDAVERGEAIDLRFTATRDLGTVTITEASGVEVSGRVEVTEKIPMTNFDGTQKSQPSIDLIRLDGAIIARTNGQPDGTFHFPKVLPGTYYLVGNTQPPNFVTFGVQEIHVGATPLGGIVLALPDEPPVITGRFEMETQQGMVGVTAQALLQSVRPTLTISAPRPADGQGNFSMPTPMGPGGPLTGLQFSMRGKLPTDAYIATVTQGNATYTRDPFPVVVSGEPVRVLFKQDGAKIRGKVAISGNPARPAYIVLAPIEREATLYYRTASTDHAGAFQLEAIAPGTYDLFAFDREANYMGEQTLLAYPEAGMSVTVTAGQSLTINPKVTRIEK